MDCRDSFCLTSPRQKKFGRLEEMKEEEASYKHQEDNCAGGDIEISPAPILLFVAACFARSYDIAREERGVTFVIGEESPSD